MPQIQTVYDGNYIVWQRKFAEINIDLKADIIILQQFGLIIAESTFFDFTIEQGVYVSIEIAMSDTPNTWTMIHAGDIHSDIMSASGWTQDISNQSADFKGNWQENTYIYNHDVGLVARYVRVRISTDAFFTPLQLVAVKKVMVRDQFGTSLVPAETLLETNALGWKTGEILKEIMEDLLENRILLATTAEELTQARVSPKGTWDAASELYDAPAPRIFASLVERLNDLEQDAERRLTAKKVIVPVEVTLPVLAGTSVIVTDVVANAPYRVVRGYAGGFDAVDVLTQLVEGVGSFEEPLRENGELIFGKVSYGIDRKSVV